MRAFIIGVGGVGSFLTPALCLLIKPENVTVMDGDKLEDKNLNRQLFDTSDIGSFKAEALARKYGCEFQNEWFAFGGQPYDSDDVLMGCTDNNPSRAAILEACDYHKCMAVFGANETYSAESSAYFPRWKGGPLDPRTYNPDILTDQAGDPRRASVGCTGKAQEETPQLVTANMLAAALMLRMYEVWTNIARKLNNNEKESLPYRLVANQTKLETHRIKDTL